MLKYVTLAFIALSTTAAFAETKEPSMPAPSVAKSNCPEGQICVTPEQLQAFVNQQIEAARLNEMAGKPEFKDVVTQYQKVMQERNPAPPVLPKK